ncbi:MAG: B12-binding domain-containing radical SAM protein [Chloroflexi bacterium]|nr:B12-binding domain-containing radical SAM protein [Chloroflexota bacterium]
MDLLLAHGYYLHEDPHELAVMKPYPPLGILYISAYLKSRGFSVGVFDSTFRKPVDFDAMLAAERPTVVGLYCNLMTKFNILAMMAAAKQAGARVVLCGPEPPYYAEEYLARGADVVVIGEGEKAMEELIAQMAARGPNDLGHVSGIVFRDGAGKFVRTPPRPMIKDLDALPFPDREAIDLPEYVRVWREHHGRGSVSLICARGCPYHCDWCSHSVYGETHRRHSPARMADEVQTIVERYRPDQLWYADDVFTIKHSWFFDYAAELERRNLRLPFECISRADRLNERVVETLSKMGCYRLWIGSESGSQRVLEAMRREVSVEAVQAMTHLCRRHGIEVGMFIMLGYDGEEESDIAATVDHLKRANPDVFLTTVAYPIKGTGYYKKVEGKVLARSNWELRTDRDLTVAGRHSRRYYESAIRWMVGEVNLHKQLSNGRKDVGQIAKSAANAVRGRMGMIMTRDELER